MDRKQIIDWKQIIAGIIIGGIVSFAGTFFSMGQRLATLETQVENYKRIKEQKREKQVTKKPLMLNISGNWNAVANDLKYDSEGLAELFKYTSIITIEQKNHIINCSGTVKTYDKKTSNHLYDVKYRGSGVLYGDGHITIRYEQHCELTLNYGVMILKFSFDGKKAEGFYLAKRPDKDNKYLFGKLSLDRIR
ncbi:hypothetical protein GMMP15_1590030 [Candidatus Magnetomoraceae bacterium gMMP-15]